MTKHPDHISASKFLDELRRFQKGSVTRRHFLGVTGLGLATAVLVGQTEELPHQLSGVIASGDALRLR